jgi:pilus assembly protein CpaC
LTAVSGETASFLAGGEFPIPVPQNNGTTTIDFKKFGVSLSFLATIGAHDRISLRVRPEVSQLSTAGAIIINSISVPSLTTRRAETTVELGSGQSFAIAGLLQNNITNDIKKFPGLGYLPILGALFRSTRFQRDESELVIIVTPYLVRPVSSKRLAAPTDGFVSPNDSERVVGGASYRPQVGNPSPPPLARSGATLLGPTGFDLE